MKFKSLVTGLALSVSALAATGALATELRLATIAPDNTVWANQANRYADRVNELGGGELSVEVFGNAQLGTMADTMKMTLSGRVDIWFGVTPVMAAVTPELATLTFPYAFDSNEQVKCAVPKLEDDIRAAIGDKYQLITMMSVGTQNVGMVGEASMPDDLKGKKIRSAPLPSALAFFKGMGATPQPLSAAETPAALSTGLVEGVDLATAFYVVTGSNKTASNLIKTGHVINVASLIVSARTWKKLSDEEKAILMQAADAVPFETVVDEIVAFESQMEQAHIGGGGTVTELSDEERAAWTDLGRGTWDAVLDDMGDDAKAFMDKVQAARASCAAS